MPTTYLQREIKNEVAPPILPLDHPACGNVSNFKWTYIHKFPLDKIRKWEDGEAVDPDSYTWDYEEWKTSLKKTHSLGDAQWLQDTYMPYPDRMPIVVVLGTDGHYYLWDGDKRVGHCLSVDVKTAPAFVGT